MKGKKGCQSFDTVLLTDWTAAKEIQELWNIKKAASRLRDQTCRLRIAKIEKQRLYATVFLLKVLLCSNLQGSLQQTDSS